ncbi:MAG: hypothetical protein M3Y80_08180, partial [Verrucomicrobiota bacterium]|nr:hypothetical protein [Verrucomicrobiota bacterium]
MKLPKFIKPKKKLRATTTTRRSLAPSDEMEYEEMSEPNMKLSRALLIVLVLHLVAVAGIFAFNTIKSRQGAFPPAATTAAAPKIEAPEPAVTKPEPGASPGAAMQIVGKVGPSAGKSAGKDERSIEPAVAARALPVTPDPANTYTVAKGDNPVKIAKKLKVSE